MKFSINSVLVLCILVLSGWFTGPMAYAQQDSLFHFVFVSDAHYGLTKKTFRGQKNVPSTRVNQAVVAAINSLPDTKLPKDGGVRAGKKIRYIAFVVNGGDVANRMEEGIQSATDSWEQFRKDYIEGLRVKAAPGVSSRFIVIPGNHDISNAIGHHKINVDRDPAAYTAIYNRAMQPEKQVTAGTFDYTQHKVNFSFFDHGIHFQFVHMWPDTAARVWMKADLDTVAGYTPVIVFTHDEPDIEAKHFTNPYPPHDINRKDKFENLLQEHYRPGEAATAIAQEALVDFLLEEPRIRAYFHGNYNWNEFYDYQGPGNRIRLPVFRVDSPMKGEQSASDESLLSFMVVSVDMKSRMLTARECFYNRQHKRGQYKVQFGAVRTIPL